jgi:hypothetical protein
MRNSRGGVTWMALCWLTRGLMLCALGAILRGYWKPKKTMVREYRFNDEIVMRWHPKHD